VGSTKSSISIVVEGDPATGIVAEGNDLGVEPQTAKELLDFSTGDSLLGDYTSFVTRRNMYPIMPGTRAAPEARRGSALEPPEEVSAARVFAASNTDEIDRSSSGMFDAAGVPLRTIVDKVGNGSARDGNYLLPEVVSAPANSDAAAGQSNAVVGAFAMLKKYNNMGPTSDTQTYTDGYSSVERFGRQSQIRIQTGEGVYEPQTVELSADIGQSDLVEIARSMMIRAAGWDRTISPGDAGNPEGVFNAASLERLDSFPGISGRQSGPDPYRARDAYGMPASATGDSILEGQGDILPRTTEDAKYTSSNGSSDTPYSPYLDDPSTAIGNRIQALQSGIAIMGLACLLDRSFIAIDRYVSELQIKSDSSDPEHNDNVLRGPYFMGTSLKSNVSSRVRAYTRVFTTTTGIYSYRACVAEALYGLFGINFVDLGRTEGFDINTTVIARAYKEEITKIANNTENGANFYQSPMGMSHGFWKSVSQSAIRTIKNLQNAAVEGNASDFVSAITGLSNSLAIKILNVFAQIGYQRLVIQSIPTSEIAEGGQVKNPWGIDDYPNAPGTRQMKSRDGVLSKTSLAWRNSALPSMFLLPVEAMSATLDLDFLTDKEAGSNPIKGMLGSTLFDKVYVNATRNSSMIPAAVAKRLEDRLGAEYLPFYFRDLRTNEIIAFHGFLEQISDGFTPSNTTTTGFGRSDGVRNYSSTKRAIGGTFWIVATSKEDFDEMWFKINKLTTMVYPQYTKGRLVRAKNNTLGAGLISPADVDFEQPFSQLAGGTPIIRMRVGDLIKSNYSRYNFSRLFGVGNDTFKGVDEKGLGAAVISAVAGGLGGLRSSSLGGFNFDARLVPFLVYAASPMEAGRLTGLIGNATGQAAADFAAEAAGDAIAYLLKNGFVNPLIYGDRKKMFAGEREETDGLISALYGAGTVLLKSRGTPYIVNKDNSTVNMRLHRPVLVKVGSKVKNSSGPSFNVTIVDESAGNLNGAKLIVSDADLYIDTASIVDVSGYPGLLLALGLISLGTLTNAGGAAIQAGIQNNSDIGPIDLPLSDVVGSLGRTFTSPIYNPITRAMEERMGEGLAGVFTNLSFTWMEAPWETDWNARAPMACKVTFGFDPIHDISPGLDASGFNRAPIYNVGQIMNDSFGQPRRDGGAASRYFYKRGGAVAEDAKGPMSKTE
jgi:hypothetical protein